MAGYRVILTGKAVQKVEDLVAQQAARRISVKIDESVFVCFN